MNTSNILGLAGILATVVFGIWGIVIVIHRRYPGQLTYIKESSIGLFDSIVRNLPELEVLYNNAPVGQGLVLMKGAILNTGNKDITDSMIEQKLAFAVPPDFRWLTAKIVGNSGNVKASVTIDNHSLIFSTGLFRCNKFIRFQAIVEMPIHGEGDVTKNETIEDRLDKSIDITHRIADTQKVTTLELPNTRQTKSRFIRYLTLFLAIAMLVIVVGGVGLYKGFPGETHFIVNDTNSIPHEVRTDIKLDGYMTLKGVSDGFRKKVLVDEFFKQDSFKPKVVLSSDIKPMVILSFLYLLLPLVMCLHAYREMRRANRFRSLLGIEDHQETSTKRSTVA